LSRPPNWTVISARSQRAAPSRPTRRRRYLAVSVIVAITMTPRLSPAWAGPVTAGSLQLSGPTQAVELGDAARSIAEVEQAIKCFEKREFDRCIEQLAQARKAHPELAPAQALFAKLAFLSNQGALIRPALERAVAEDPDHPDVFILFANLALAEGRVTDAAVHLEKAAALAADKRWSDEQRARFERLTSQGNALVAESRGDWKAARAALEAWLKQEPAHAHARQRLGKALFGLGEFDAAYEALQQATKADPKLEPAALSVGWLFTRSGKLKKAGEWMDYAIKAAPESLPVQLGVAAWLLEQGRGDEAQSHVDAAAKLDSSSTEVRRMVGLAARERKDLDQAEKVFQALTEDAPADAWARNQLALVLADQDNPSKRQRALELAELSVKQNPKAADALATVGTVYYRLKRLDDAEKVLQAVVDSGKGNSDAAYILAHVKADRGQVDAALPLLKKALNAPGLFILRKDAQEWLDRLTAK
jgi:tetratricopeptide (TPR) repeat protein